MLDSYLNILVDNWLPTFDYPIATCSKMLMAQCNEVAKVSMRNNAAMYCVEMLHSCLILMIHYYCLATVEDLYLVRRERVSPSQDCCPVLYSTWNRVRIAKICDWASFTISIVRNVDVISSKQRTKTWAPVNCTWWPLHHAPEWSKTFFVVEWKYERIRGGSVSTAGL